MYTYVHVLNFAYTQSHSTRGHTHVKVVKSGLALWTNSVPAVTAGERGIVSGTFDRDDISNAGLELSESGVESRSAAE